MLGRRIFYGGIGLAIVWLVFLVVPLWLRDVDHPLAALPTVDVCAYVNDAVLGTLPDPPVAVARGVPGETDTGKAACQVELPAEEEGDADAPNLWVMVTTERMLVVDGRPQRTDRVVDTWLRESGASGSDVTAVKGPWRRAAVIRDRARPEAMSLLADDAGVIVWVNGRAVDYPAFVAFAEAIARALRIPQGAQTPR